MLGVATFQQPPVITQELERMPDDRQGARCQWRQLRRGRMSMVPRAIPGWRGTRWGPAPSPARESVVREQFPKPEPQI